MTAEGLSSVRRRTVQQRCMWQPPLPTGAVLCAADGMQQQCCWLQQAAECLRVVVLEQQLQQYRRCWCCAGALVSTVHCRD